MIDTKELRRLAQAANASPDGDVMSWIEGMQRLQGALLQDDVIELLDRLEAAEKERDALRTVAASWKGLAQQFGNEADALRAKIEAMERQEPVAWYYVTNGAWDCYSREIPPEDAYDAGSLKALYALPGAQPAPSVPDHKTIRDLLNESGLCAYDREGDLAFMVAATKFAALAAAPAPEAKP